VPVRNEAERELLGIEGIKWFERESGFEISAQRS